MLFIHVQIGLYALVLRVVFGAHNFTNERCEFLKLVGSPTHTQKPCTRLGPYNRTASLAVSITIYAPAFDKQVRCSTSGVAKDFGVGIQ